MIETRMVPVPESGEVVCPSCGKSFMPTVPGACCPHVLARIRSADGKDYAFVEFSVFEPEDDKHEPPSIPEPIERRP